MTLLQFCANWVRQTMERVEGERERGEHVKMRQIIWRLLLLLLLLLQLPAH